MRVSKIVEVAENYGVVSGESIGKFFNKSTSRELEKLDTDFRDALEECTESSESAVSGVFNYLASASFRAEEGCTNPECRAQRITEFARFSLLYAEKVIFPIYMHKRFNPSWLNGNLRILAEIRPLLDLGIVVPTESKVCICKSCMNEFSPVIAQVDNAAWDAAEQIKVKYLGARHGRKNYRKNEWAFQFTFPAEFDPDTPTLLIVSELKPMLKSFVQKKCAEGTELPVQLVRDSGILMSIFRYSSEDYILQRTYGRRTSCTYLSDSGREVRMLGKLLGESPEDARNAMFSSLLHNIPLFSDIRLESLVSVRQDDGDAFVAYRAALNEAAREANAKGISLDRSKEIYTDILLPKLTALERKHDVLRSRFRKDALIEFGVPIAAMVVGALSGGSHSGIANVLELAGGVGLVNSAGKHLKAISNSESSMDGVKSDPLYFLLRMKREYARNCLAESTYAKVSVRD